MTAENFLRWNKNEIYKGLLAVEGHLRNFYDIGCIIKHLSEIESHCDEAISHSAELNLDEISLKFKELRDKIRELKEKITEMDPIEAIRTIRRLRKEFESFNKEFEIKCACGHNQYTSLEEEYAHKILDMLSKEYGIPKPKLTILDECPLKEPVSYAQFIVKDQPEIILCKGAIDLHKILHEWHHYMQYLENKPLDEKQAEEYALVKVRHGETDRKYIIAGSICLIGSAIATYKKRYELAPILFGLGLILITA